MAVASARASDLPGEHGSDDPIAPARVAMLAAMSVARLALALLLVLLAAPTRADELRLVGERLELTGTLGSTPLAGWLQIGEDATYTGERRVGDGAAESLGGRAAIVGKDLVLMAPDAAPRRYVRADADGRVRWRCTTGAEVETLTEPGRAGTKASAMARALERGDSVGAWLAGNRGVVDATPGLEVHRSKEPTPADVVDWQARERVRTILSLNGAVDDERSWTPPATPGQPRPPAEKVRLGAFITSRGLEHPFVGMSASRAPSDEELVAVFRVLLDDARRPILIHCKGGSDRTGVISALYAIEFQGATKAEAKATMRRHLWLADGGTEIQGAYVDLYQPGTLTRLLERNGVAIPDRLRRR